jgi:hypothetical protein
MVTNPYTTRDTALATLPPNSLTSTITFCGCSESYYTSKNIPCNHCKDKDKLIANLERQINALRFQMNRKVRR